MQTSDTADKSNRMPNTLTHIHIHTAAKYVGYLHNKPVIKVIDFFCQNKKKVNLELMEFFFEDTAR